MPIRLSRAEQARLATIRQWVLDQERAKREVEASEYGRKILDMLERTLGKDRRLADAYETPISHVRWLLAVLDREGVR